jgi:hypothetical protein
MAVCDPTPEWLQTFDSPFISKTTRAFFLLFEQQIGQYLSLAFVRFNREQMTEARDVFAADKSL